jgi:hypothetical protein
MILLYYLTAIFIPSSGNKDSSQVIKQYHVKYITTAGNKDSSQPAVVLYLT